MSYKYFVTVHYWLTGYPEVTYPCQFAPLPLSLTGAMQLTGYEFLDKEQLLYTTFRLIEVHGFHLQYYCHTQNFSLLQGHVFHLQ